MAATEIGVRPPDGPRIVDETEWAPRRLRTLMIPADYEDVPLALTDLRGPALNRALPRPIEGGMLALAGRMRVVQREVRGQHRPVAVLRCPNGGRVWVEADPGHEGVYEILEGLDGKRIALYGRVYRWKRYWLIQEPEPLPRSQTGVPRPRYAIHHKTRHAIARDALEEVGENYLLDRKVANEYRRYVRDSANFRRYVNASTKKLLDEGLKNTITRGIATGHPRKSDARAFLSTLFHSLHFPESRREVDQALEWVDRIAATCVMAERTREKFKRMRSRARKKLPANVTRLKPGVSADLQGYLRQLAANLPFTPTDEQFQAAAEALADIDHGQPMRRTLSGDVGTGKTAVFGLVVSAMIDAGHNVAVMAPRTLVAEQTHRKLREMIPGVATALIAGNQSHIEEGARLWVGTVGIHSRKDVSFSLVVVDEQQLFSKSQREFAVDDGAHLLEVTATPIPRSKAMIQTGEHSVSRLWSSHVDKNFVTRIWRAHERRPLFAEIDQDLSAGQIIMVIYPGVNPESQLRDGTPRSSVLKYAELWERQYPGNVRICHGRMSAEEKHEAVNDIKAGHAQILLGTSVLEVGIDVEGVMRTVIVQADQFGLAQMHQFRGRAARQGGTAYCDLLLTSDRISGKTMERLHYFTRTQDGFALAEEDMILRGAGDVMEDGHRQSGNLPESPFKDRDLSSHMIHRVTQELESAYAADAKARASRRRS